MKDKDKTQILTILPKDVITHLNSNPRVFHDKKFRELLIGWILVQFFSKEERDSLYIGFPIKQGKDREFKNEICNIDWLLRNHQKVIEDLDVDIVIGNGKYLAHFQVTRYFHPYAKSPNKRIAKLILDKCNKYAKDSKLNLVVNIESQPNICVEELFSIIKHSRMPFEAIFLLKKASGKIGHFTCFQIYPKIHIGKEIQIPLNV